MMSEIALQLESSVEVNVSPAFAWQFRTDVSNWNDPPAQFALNGPFEVGSRGTTLMSGGETLHWRIREVRHGELFVIEMQLDSAVLTFEWHFDPVSDDRTKLTRRIVLSGENAGAFAGQVEAGFGPNLPDGMRRITAEMGAAERRSNSAH
jgi:Polyketide cyclase / dehydrase and lipid transport